MNCDIETFLQVLANGPLLSGDAVVVLCGEDSAPRLAIAAQLMRDNAAPVVVLSGGKDKPPRWHGADTCFPLLMGLGVSPERIITETASQDTHEQAVNVVAMADERGWKRLLLVASPYHMPRAFLTFLQAMLDRDEAGRPEGVEAVASGMRVVPITTSQAPWGQPPEGMTLARVRLFEIELGKIERYHNHVAHPSEGTEYLLSWEGR